MGNLTYALVIIMSINVLMFMGQMAMFDINPLAPEVYNCRGSLMSEFDRNRCLSANNYSLDTSIASENLPNANPSVDSSSGNLFTDTFNAVKNWLLDSLGLRYLFDIVSAPKYFLDMTGMPPAYSWAIATLWYSVTLFLLIAWLKGGDA